MGATNPEEADSWADLWPPGWPHTCCASIRGQHSSGNCDPGEEDRQHTQMCGCSGAQGSSEPSHFAIEWDPFSNASTHLEI